MNNKKTVFGNFSLKGVASAILENVDVEFEYVPLNAWSIKNSISEYFRINDDSNISICTIYDLDVDEETRKYIKNLLNKQTNIPHGIEPKIRILKDFKDVYNVSESNPNYKQYQMLLKHTEDYSFGKNEFPIGYNLNILLWNYFKFANVDLFIKRFKNGLTMFTKEELHFLKMFNDKMNRYCDRVMNTAHTGVVPVNGEQKTFIAVFVENHYQHASKRIFTDHPNCDIAMLIDQPKSKVYFRRRWDETIDLQKLANKLCKGTGKPFAASGKLNESVLKLVQNFKKV